MWEIVVYTTFGVLAGTITGLIPGIHVNLVATLLLAAGVNAQAAPFLVAMAITHSFLDVIPGVLLGAPESDMALGVLPGHRYLLRGNGLMAIKLTLIGSYFGLLVAFILVPVWKMIIGFYDALVSYMGFILIGISAYMILRDQKRYAALLVYVLSAALGWALLHREILLEPLFPLFSGLFGIATLLYSLGQRQHLPKQQDSQDIALRKADTTKAILAGNVSGFLTSMLPGLGSAQAAILGMNLTGKIGDHGFLIMIGTINTVNFSLSLLTWLLLDKARNGAVVALSTLMEPTSSLIVTLCIVAVLAGSISVYICLKSSRWTLAILNSLSYQKICLSVIGIIGVLVAVLTGWRGILVLIISTAIGLIPAILKCGRAHAMGCLLFPVAMFFL